VVTIDQPHKSQRRSHEGLHKSNGVQPVSQEIHVFKNTTKQKKKKEWTIEMWQNGGTMDRC
jgi:hypothetical protein